MFHPCSDLASSAIPFKSFFECVMNPLEASFTPVIHAPGPFKVLKALEGSLLAHTAILKEIY